MDEKLWLEFACTPDEWQQARELVIAEKFGGGSKWRAAAVIFLLLAAVASQFVDGVGQAQLWLPYLMAGIFVVLFAVIAYKRGNRKKDTPEATVLIEITQHEVRLAGDKGWGISPWSAFGTLVESETLFVLPTRSGNMVFVFPKRAFPDTLACDWFRNIASAAAAGKQVLRKRCRASSRNSLLAASGSIFACDSPTTWTA